MESRKMAAQETFPNLSASLGSGEKNERCLPTQMDLENRCYPNISWHLRWTIQNVWDHFLRQLYQLHGFLAAFPWFITDLYKSDLGFVPLDISNFKVEHSKFPSFLVKITAHILVKPCPFWCCLVEQFFSCKTAWNSAFFGKSCCHGTRLAALAPGLWWFCVRLRARRRSGLCAALPWRGLWQRSQLNGEFTKVITPIWCKILSFPTKPEFVIGTMRIMRI